MDTPWWPQETTIISEPGLYKLIQTSRKPAAKRFDRWVCNTNLPLIDQTVFTLLPLRRPIKIATSFLGDCRNDPARERKLGRLLRWRLRRVGYHWPTIISASGELS
jgi:hypothetical protein